MKAMKATKAMRAKSSAMTATGACVCRRVYWSKGQTSETVRRSVHGACCLTAQSIWILQGGWRDQHEAETKTGEASKEGREPVYEGALRLQSKACFEDRSSPPNEEVQGDDQLRS